MTIEIGENNPIYPEFYPRELLPIQRCSPGGLTTVPDTILSTPHPKPNFLIRSTLFLGLWTLHASLWVFHLFSWAIHKATGPCSEKSLYQELRQLLDKKGDLASFLEKEEKRQNIGGFILRELRALPELQPHLKEILDGANIRMIGDNGFFYHRWSHHREAYSRVSSHSYQKDQCYGLGYICFWLDLEGNTRFQFENTPFKGFINTVYHIIDMLRYWRDNEQQGVAGMSAYTESHCLNIPIDLRTISTKSKTHLGA
jgi:hypothetical protein